MDGRSASLSVVPPMASSSSSSTSVLAALIFSISRAMPGGGLAGPDCFALGFFSFGGAQMPRGLGGFACGTRCA
eukprot:10370674-Alexandrium_andersonii.AAC.1